MILIAETVGVALLATISFFFGKWLSNRKYPYWILGVVLPFIVMFLIALARWVDQLETVPPFSWILSGRIEFILVAISATVELSVLSARVKEKRMMLWLNTLTIVVAIYFILPFIFPAILYKYHLNLKNSSDQDGVCFQSNTYNCGPAAAVSALHRLGIYADEGILAIHSKSSPIIGAQPDLLCRAINKLYNSKNIKCELENLKSLDELKNSLPHLAAIKFGLMVDHWIAVLEVTEDYVVIANPLEGIEHIRHGKFKELWKKNGLSISSIKPAE